MKVYSFQKKKEKKKKVEGFTFSLFDFQCFFLGKKNLVFLI